jgi:ribosomal protein S18 acetylase RimI-like enzyme
MVNDTIIEELLSIQEHSADLSELLIQVVRDGASIGFLPPLIQSEADHYWDHVINPDVILYIAKVNNRVVGSVQLHLCSKQNGSHRAEIAKLMTHPEFRRNGIGRMLMHKAEERAIQENKSLIVLDTREGDASNLLYLSLGFNQAGRIPDFARSANGELHPTIIYYKHTRLLVHSINDCYTFRQLTSEQEIPYDLLLQADPSRKLIDDYIHKGLCYLAYDKGNLVGEVVLLPKPANTYEIVNVAVKVEYQGKGIGRKLIERAILEARRLDASSIEIGTGNSSLHQLKLYQKCGFRITEIDPDFFIRNYEDEIFEDGIQCRDMIRLRLDL